VTDLAKIPLRGEGNVTWDDLRGLMREVLAKQDPRYPRNDFASAFVYTGGVGTIGDAAKMTTQRPLPIVNAGNRLSAQTTNPLSSTGTVSTAQIVIASHVVQYGFGTVSYNSGTITGLTPLTLYYVYASDPDYEGGAVTYAAATNAATVVSSNDYYYVGTITTANSTPSGTVTAATSANPIVITITNHGFSSGNSVIASTFTGDFVALNGNTYTATVLTANTFSIPVDGSAYAAWASGGLFTRVSAPTGGAGLGGGWGWTGDLVP
jgi:hypothetical protein